MDWMLMPLRRYADFSGRSCRKEYWMFVLFQLMLFFGLFLIAGLLGAMTSTPGQKGPVFAIFMAIALIILLALFIPSLAVQVRRFHDQNMSGWMVLLRFIPYIGGIIITVFMCIAGTSGHNKYGPDPLDPYGDSNNYGAVFE
jgi:uncharacterized membrane protein YhaH (DUF805 family)